MRLRVVSMLSLVVVLGVTAFAGVGPLAAKSSSGNQALNGFAKPPNTLLYDNGPINGTIDAWTLDFGYAVANTYTISGPANSAQIGLWAFPGDSLSQIDWAFGSAPGLADYSSGTSSVTYTFLGTNAFGYDIGVGNFSVSAPAGSGWFTIQNAVVPSGDPIYWDENDGPSNAWESTYGYDPCLQVGVGSYPCSESFQLYGPSSATPEGGTFLLMGTGLVGLAGVVRRKLNI